MGCSPSRFIRQSKDLHAQDRNESNPPLDLRDNKRVNLSEIESSGHGVLPPQAPLEFSKDELRLPSKKNLSSLRKNSSVRHQSLKQMKDPDNFIAENVNRSPNARKNSYSNIISFGNKFSDEERKLTSAAIRIQRRIRGMEARIFAASRKISKAAERMMQKNLNPFLSPAENACNLLLEIASVIL